MTRFARAKGSKSSNERVPEQASSWSEMRRDLHRESVRKAAEEQIERESRLESQQNLCTNSFDKSVPKKKVTDPVDLVSFDDFTSFCPSGKEPEPVTYSSTKKVIKKETKKVQEVPNKKRPHPDSVPHPEDKEDNQSFPETHSSRLESLIKDNASLSGEGTSSNNLVRGGPRNSQLNGKQKNVVRHPFGAKEKPQRQGKFSQESNDTEPDIGGNFKGYPVPKEDAETLTDAYNNLRKEGMTHKEAMERIKPERRRAEKRLARLKSMICFRCRKPGHRLSDCPMGGIECDVCFKCGSTTHKYQECKKKGSFVNAKCFICGIVGHLSAQCPENTHGVYPEGGECKICGEKTHLVKDCPQNRNNKEQHAGTTEFDDYFDEKRIEPPKPKKKKITKVQF